MRTLLPLALLVAVPGCFVQAAKEAADRATAQRNVTDPHDDKSPCGVVMLLDDAYRAKDIEAAVRCRDFQSAAQLEIAKASPSQTAFGVAPSVLEAKAKELEAAYREQLQTQGFPDLTGVEYDSAKLDILVPRFDLVYDVVTMNRKRPDGTIYTERVAVETRDDGTYRVIGPAE